MTPLMSIAGGSVQERKIAVELRLDPVNPCGGALGAIHRMKIKMCAQLGIA